MHASRAFTFIGAIGACLTAGPLAAQVGTPAFRLDLFTTDDGLPSHTISDLTFTPDGQIWLATTGGLVRYDGTTWHVFSSTNVPSMRSNRLESVHLGLGDTLWLLFDPTAVLPMVRETFGAPRGMGPVVRAIAQGSDGTLWGWGDSLFRLDGTEWVGTASVPPLTPAEVTGDPMPMLVRTPEGDVVGLERGTSRLLRFGPDGATELGRGARALVRQGARVLNAAALARYRTPRGAIPRLVDRAGLLWVTRGARLEAWAADTNAAAAFFDLPPETSVNVAGEDREGNLWFGTEAGGLYRVQPVAVSVIGTAEGFLQEQVQRVFGCADGSVYAVDPNHSFFAVADGRATLLARARDAGDPAGARHIVSVLCARDGTRWLGGTFADGEGVRGTRPDGRTAWFGTQGEISQLIEDPGRPGVLWAKTHGRVYRVRDDGTAAPDVDVVLVPDGSIANILLDARGTLWAAGMGPGGGGRLYRIDGDSVTMFGPSDGLPLVGMRGLWEDDEGVLWVGTYGAGILRFADGRPQAVTEAQGLGDNIVSTILPDDAGQLWMAGNRGVHRVALQELRDLLDGRATRVAGARYGRNAGFRNPETSGGQGYRAPDGRLWFPTFGGLAVVDPARAIALDATTPGVVMEWVVAGGDTLRTGHAVTLPPGHRQVEIGLRTIALRSPESVRLAYRLRGAHDDWVEASPLHRAFYASLPPGTHALEVRVRGGNGAWQDVPVQLAVTVPRRFYETTGFIVLAVLVVLGSAVVVERGRVMRNRRREAELAALVASRTRDLEAARHEAEAALETVAEQANRLQELDAIKSRFFANVTHEFRTPLSLIIGPLDDLRSGRHGDLAEPARRAVDMVLGTGRRLLTLVEQLLDVARLEGERLPVRAAPADLVPHVRRLAESFASEGRRRGLAFAVEFPVGGLRVRFDPDHVDKIVANLLGNALKFCDRGGRIVLRLHAEGVPPDAWAVLEVEDSGPGIAAEDLPHVFERFYQAPGALGGTGIGLALTKELVELQGGTVTVRSLPGMGAVFTVRLPALEGAPDAPPLPESIEGPLVAVPETAAYEPGDDDRTTVLLAEDNDELRGYIADHLRDRFRVRTAGDGVEALAAARDEVPDLVICDVMMPELDGYGLLARLRADPELDFVPVILLTARSSTESRLEGLEGGADDYLTKPVNVRELLARATNLIAQRRRLRERYAGLTAPTPAPPPAVRGDAEAEAFVRRLYRVLGERAVDEDFQLDALATALAMSRSTLYRRVGEVLDTTPKALLLRYRLDLAASWLRATDAGVGEVAYGVGFRSVPHFCTKFREQYGVTPTAYRATPIEVSGRNR